MSKKYLDKDSLDKCIAVVVGTRPGIIKFSPVIRALQKRKVPFFIVHTGQHYSYNMDKKFFKDLNLPEPDFKNGSVKNIIWHGAQTAEMIRVLEDVFIRKKPKIVIVGGDANTNLAGALAARKLGISVAHIEAGLRSNDWSMPEEHNRVMIDHISEYLFPPTEKAKSNLIEDNVKGIIKVTGNTIVDAVYQNVDLARSKSKIMKELKLTEKRFILVTAHREENVDSENILKSIIKTFNEIQKNDKMPLLFPIHPRTLKRMKEFGLEKELKEVDNIKLITPPGYLDFLILLSSTRLALTDSGGIQEESCILKTPCVTLRQNTERPETIEAGANCIGGTRPESVLKAVKKMLMRKCEWKNPFGDGKAGNYVVDFLAKEL